MASAILPPTMKRVAIGAARVDEAEQILKLQRLSYRTEAALYDDWTLPPLTQTLRKLLEQLPRPRSRRAGAVALPSRPPNAPLLRSPPGLSWSPTVRRPRPGSRGPPGRRRSSRSRLRRRRRSRFPAAPASAPGARRFAGPPPDAANSPVRSYRRQEDPRLPTLANLARPVKRQSNDDVAQRETVAATRRLILKISARSPR
jgi:hypothetical protein